MPKLSDYSPDQVKVISPPAAPSQNGATAPLRLSDVHPDQVKVISTPTPEEDWVDTASRAALKGMVTVGRGYDRFLTAPTRAAVDAAAKFENPFSAFGNQFGKDPELAPTGKEIASKRFGFSEDKILPTPFKGITGQNISVSPAQVAGTGIDVLADPVNVLPIAQGLKAAGKGVAAGAEMAAKGAARAAELAGKLALSPEMTNVIRQKLASSFGNIPKEKIAEYMARPVERVNAARDLEEIGRQVVGDAEKLQKLVSEGSAQSYKVLEGAKGRLGADDVQEIRGFADNQLRGLAVGQAESGIGGTAKAGAQEVRGILSDLDKAAGSKPAQRISSPILDASGREVFIEVPSQPGSFSFVDAKKILQNLDGHIDRASKLGEFNTPSNKALIQIRGAIRQKLGERVPEFNQVMQQVSSDTRLLDEVRGFGDLNTVTGRLKAAATDHRSRLADQEALNSLALRMGTDYITEAEDRLILDSFKKDAGRGTRYQALGAAGGAAIGGLIAGGPGATVGTFLGGLGGTVFEKEAGGIAKALLDQSRGFSAATVPNKSIGEAIKEIRLTPRLGLEKGAKAAQVFSTQDVLSGADLRREAIRRRIGRDKNDERTPRLGE